MIDLVAVDEHDDVGVLLDRSGFTQVGVDRALVGALFQRAVELRQGDHRAVEFLGQGLERARDLGNLVGAVVAGRARDAHQLQVVDHDHADLAVLARQAAGAGAHFGRRDAGGIVDEQLALVEQVDRRGQARPVIVVQLTGTHLGLVDTAERGEHTHHDRVAGHLQGEHQDHLVRAQYRVLHQVHGEGGLTHGRTAGDDHQVGRLQAAGHAIEVGEAGGDAGQALVGVEQLVDAVDGLDQDLVDPHRAAGLGPRFGDLEDLPLGLVEHFHGALALRRVGHVGDVVADADQLTQGCTLADDLRIGLDVGHRGRVLGQLAEVAETSDLAQVALLVQLLGQGHHVERRVALGQGEDGAEDQPVVMPVEVTIGDRVGDPFPGVVVEHQAAQHGLFGLDGMRRHLECGGFQVVLLRDADIVHGTCDSESSEALAKPGGLAKGSTKNNGHAPQNGECPIVGRLAPSCKPAGRCP